MTFDKAAVMLRDSLTREHMNNVPDYSIIDNKGFYTSTKKATCKTYSKKHGPVC